MINKEFTLSIGENEIIAQFNKLTPQAHGSVLLKSGETVVLATAVMDDDNGNNPGYFNLTVEYQERYYASGEILGSRFNKREGKPSDEAILSGRMIDRTIRPLFNHHILNAIQVVVTVIAVGKVDPGVLAINAASLALATSDIPWSGPIGAVHISQAYNADKQSNLKVNNYLKENYSDPTINYQMELTACGKTDEINMIEAGAYEATEEEVILALELANQEISKLITWQNNIVAEIGKPKRQPAIITVSQTIKDYFQDQIADKVSRDIFGTNGKTNLYNLEKEWAVIAKEKWSDDSDAKVILKQASDYFHEFVDETIHKAVLQEGKRCDLRKLNEVRSLYCQAGGVSPVLHGSGVFFRGDTNVLSVLTLGGPEDANELDEMEVKGNKRFMHHYNFPPFSVGQTGRVGGFNRRAIGHGALGEKALQAVIPDKTTFPYTIRLVSETMSSNGSSSQASICASTIALMDGGVPIKAPVAGIAMGVMIDSKDKSKFKVLTDIQGPEDHHGDMDCKVAGTRNGITAIQLDTKVSGVSLNVIKEALTEAKLARLLILDEITKVISEPRADISPRAPKISVLTIPVEKIGLVIGSGGKTINEIKEKTGAEITIEDDGTVYCTGTNGSSEQAKKIISEMTKEWSVGDKADGEVVKVLDEVGAIVKFGGFNEGMVHISELASFRVQKVSDIVNSGQKVPVTIIKIDKEKNRIGLSIKQDHPDFFTSPY